MHVFPLLAPVACFPALSTGYVLSPRDMIGLFAFLVICGMCFLWFSSKAVIRKSLWFTSSFSEKYLNMQVMGIHK